MADGEYMRFAHGRCSLPVSAAKPQQSGSSKPKCTQCGAARSRTKPHEVSVLCRECYRKSVGYATPVACRCLWCFATFEVPGNKIAKGRQTGWFCSRECSFADRALHGRPDGTGTRAAWRKYGAQFEQKPSPATAACADCGGLVGSRFKRCAECSRQLNNKQASLRARSQRSLVRKCPCCALAWSAIGKAGARQYCYTEECNNAFEIHLRAQRRQHKRRSGTNHRKRARHFGVAYESFNLLDVLARDRWRCQLCGVKTPKAKRGSMDDDAPELDHVVPLSMGGGHTRENTQCLCRRCNGAKSNTARGQLSLGL